MENEGKLIVGLLYINKLLKTNPEIGLHNAAFTVSRYLGDKISSRELYNKYQEYSVDDKLELFNIIKVKDKWALVSKVNPNRILKIFNDNPDSSTLNYEIRQLERLFIKENYTLISTLLKEQEKNLKYNLLNTVVFTSSRLTESSNSHAIFEQIELYEGFLDSIKTYLKGKYDDAMTDVGSTITNFKDAGVIIHDIIADSEKLETVSTQIGKRLLRLLKDIKGDITKMSTSVQNETINNIVTKLSNILNVFYAGQRKAVQLKGWVGMLFKLGMYGFVKFMYDKLNEYSKIADFVNFFTEDVVSELLAKFDTFTSMMQSVGSLTMQRFMDFFAGLATVKEIFIDTLAEIKRKLSVGNSISATPMESAGVGRIVKGVNTTPDVGPNELKKQAAKFGNKVSKDGRPPELHTKARKNTTPNKLFNMGLTETIKKQGSKYVIYSKDGSKKLGTYNNKKDAEKRLKQIEYFKHMEHVCNSLENAIMEGKLHLEEGPRNTLRKLGKSAAIAATLGTLGGMGAIGYNAARADSGYNNTAQSSVSTDAPSQSSREPSSLAPRTSIRPTARPQQDNTGPHTKPQPRPSNIFLTDSPLERQLASYARNNGLEGDELASFMAQAATETRNFSRMEEEGSRTYFNKYDPAFSPDNAAELGNTEAGDGYRYRGRGFVQLTGRYNYARAGDVLGIDLINNPNLAAEPEYALRIAMWFWQWKVRRLTNDFTDIPRVTYLINGGDHGLHRRELYFTRYHQRMIMVGELNESDVVDLSKARDEKQLQKYHQDMKADIQSRVNDKVEAFNIAQDQGIFSDFKPGMRFTLPKGSSYKVLSLGMKTVKSNKLPTHQLDFRKKHNFGPPKFIEFDGKFYQPIVYAEEMAGEMAGSNSGFDLDKLINFETGEKRYTTFTGPKRVTEKKKQNTVKEEWYHGTADVREIRKEGGFQSRNINVTYISDPKKWKELQYKANKLRDTNKDEYFKILDELSALKKNMTTKSPIFLTNVYNVAKTYADPHRAWDYQGAEERILRVSSEDGKNLKIDATGKDFKGINIDNVTKGLVNAGISLEKIQNALEMFSLRIKNGKLSTDALAVIAQMFGFDTVDVTGVLDSYNVGKIRSTVRMVFNPSTIKIIAGLNENMSVTGTETAKLARKKGLEPGTPEWFKHWFSLPYMIDRRKKSKGREGKR